jgi:hypothetical protein
MIPKKTAMGKPIQGSIADSPAVITQQTVRQ